MKALLTLNKISIQNSKRQRGIIPLRRKKERKKENWWKNWDQLSGRCNWTESVNKVNCFAVWYVLPTMSLKNCILSLLHKTSENGFVFLYILWGCSKINAVTKVYLNFHQMNERLAEHVQGALFYWEWSKRKKKKEREREKFKYLGESHRSRKCSAKPSVYPMIFVFNWSKIALQCCVSLYNVVNQLYIYI